MARSRSNEPGQREEIVNPLAKKVNMKTHTANWRACTYGLLAAACLAGEIALAWEKLEMEGTQSWTMFAILPVIAIAAAVLIHVAIEDLSRWSWRILRAPIMAGLAVLGLSVALPASISSSGAARDAAVNQAEAANTTANDAKDEARRLKSKLVWAEGDRDATCKRFGKEHRKCLSANDSVRSYEDRREKLLKDVTETPVKVATSGENRLVWAANLAGYSNVKQDDIVNALPMLTSFSLALFGPIFGAMFLSELKRSKVPAIANMAPTTNETTGTNLEPSPLEPRRRKKKDTTEQALSFSRAYEARNGVPPSFTRLREEFPALPKGSASRVLNQYKNVA